jgi:DNA mismatch repair ATPase MutS
MASSLSAAGGGYVPHYRLAPGAAPLGSCGIEVAGFAGVPEQLMERAAQMAQLLQQRTAGRLALAEVPAQAKAQGGGAGGAQASAACAQRLGQLVRALQCAAAGGRWKAEVFHAWKGCRAAA